MSATDYGCSAPAHCSRRPPSVSLALGIGANTAIFSIASALLVRPLPGVAEPSRLIDIGRTQDGRGFDTTSYPNYLDIRARATLVSDLYAYEVEPQPISLGEGVDTERIFGVPVSGNYFRALGTPPARGRFFTDVDDHAGAAPVAVISFELWQRRFGGATDTVGRSLRLNGKPVRVVGITPSGFQGTTLLRADAWVPLEQTSIAMPRFDQKMLRNRGSVWLVMGGRLGPGTTVAQADGQLRGIGAELERAHPQDNRGKGLRALPSAVIPGRVDIVAGFLGLLMAIVSLVLVAACVNVAGMMLARASSRGREIAVRFAMGANRARMARQLITETAILFAAAGAAGLLLTRWLTTLLFSLMPALPFADRRGHAGGLAGAALCRHRIVGGGNRLESRPGRPGVTARSRFRAQERCRDARRPASAASRVHRRTSGGVAGSRDHGCALRARADARRVDRSGLHPAQRRPRLARSLARRLRRSGCAGLRRSRAGPRTGAARRAGGVGHGRSATRRRAHGLRPAARARSAASRWHGFVPRRLERNLAGSLQDARHPARQRSRLHDGRQRDARRK